VDLFPIKCWAISDAMIKGYIIVITFCHHLHVIPNLYEIHKTKKRFEWTTPVFGKHLLDIWVRSTASFFFCKMLWGRHERPETLFEWKNWFKRGHRIWCIIRRIFHKSDNENKVKTCFIGSRGPLTDEKGRVIKHTSKTKQTNRHLKTATV